MIDAWQTTVRPAYVAALPASYAMVDITARGWDDAGLPSEVLPVIESDTTAGSQSGDLDTLGHAANLAFGMGDLVAFSGSAGALRSSRVEIGPLVNGAVTAAGLFTPSAWGGTVAADLAAAVATVLDLDTFGDGTPIRVSHVLSGAPTANVTSYRTVTSGFYRSKAGFLRKRNNGR